MNATADITPEKLGKFPFVLGGMSFIPVLGVFFGLVVIVWGLATKRRGGKQLAAIGAGGISVTLVLYGALFYFGIIKRGGVYDDLRIKLAQTSINSLVQSVEFYKTEHGNYPESLKVLEASLSKESPVFVYDPTDVNIKGQSRHFFYERVGNEHYYLRGLGPDGQPFTPDDIIPHVNFTPGSTVGLLLERKPN